MPLPKLKKPEGMEARKTPHKVISELFEMSSLHGFSHLSTSSYRSAWILVITTATALFAAMSLVQLSSYNNNSISTVIEVNYPTSLVQFPHVEICRNNFVYRPNTKKLEDIVLKRGFAEDEDVFFEVLADLLTGEHFKEEKYVDVFRAIALLGYTYRGLILEVGIPCGALLHNCSWKEVDIDCEKMFQKVVSYSAICCRFDMEYFKNNTRDLDLKYTSGTRAETGLNVAINFATDSSITDEAKVYFFYNERTKFDTPYKLDPSSSMIVAVTPEVISSSADVRQMSPRKRNCGRIDKNSPDDITKYTYEECLTHYFHKSILEECKCIPFYVKDTDPRGNWENVDLCGGRSFACVDAMNKNISTQRFSKFCLHSCDEVNYKLDAVILSKTNEGFAKNKLYVYFPDSHCYKFTRVSLLTWDQVFASQGGFFGICLGGSIISIVECMFAFITILLSQAVVFMKKIFSRKNEIKPLVKRKLEILKKSFQEIDKKTST